MNKKVIGVLVCLLFVGASVTPSISGNIEKIDDIKNINDEVSCDLSNTEIEDNEINPDLINTEDIENNFDEIEPSTPENEFIEFNIAKMGATIYVPDDYSTIQAAVDNATAGDTIIVRDGTYIENVNVNKQLTIQSENGSINCVIQAANSWGSAIFLVADYINISGFKVTGSLGSYTCGIYISGDHCNISDNNASNNNIGIYARTSSNNIILNNTASNNEYGIYLFESSSYNNVINNIISNNSYGIYIYWLSRDNVLRNNQMFNNQFNFGVRGIQYFDWIQDIDTSNTVDGKPIFYLVQTSNMLINESSNAGTIYCIDCNNITIKNQTLINNYYGIFFYNTINSTVENNYICDNKQGFQLSSSSNHNTILNNNISNNGNGDGIYLYKSNFNNINNNIVNLNNRGIYLHQSNNNNILNNTANLNNNNGIYLTSGSNYNTIANNTASNNINDGIYVQSSRFNLVTNNTVISNSNYGICITYFSHYNSINKNSASNNLAGIMVSGSNNNNIADNNVTSNVYYGLELLSSNNNITNNTAINNTYGIYMIGSNNTLFDNIMFMNTYNFLIQGYNLDVFIHNIDTSNLVDGKPIYYLIEVSDLVIDSSTNPGFIGIINSVNVTIRDLTITKNSPGILFANTTNSTVDNVSVNGWRYGIYAFQSSYNDIINNNASDFYYGICLEDSSYCNITNNNVLNNRYAGIYSSSLSQSNVVTNNYVFNNSDGIDLLGSGNLVANNTANSNRDGISLSSNNIVTNNIVNTNTYGGILLGSSNIVTNNIVNTNNYCGIRTGSDNLVMNNTVSSHQHGILLRNSNNNNILDNYASNNQKGIYLEGSSYNNITNNSIANNNEGIGLYFSSASNFITKNNISNNNRGLYLTSASNNKFYLNNFMNNAINGYSIGSTNFWNSPQPIAYTYNDSEYTNYLGSHWSDYTGSDLDSDGIGDTHYNISGTEVDYYPLISPFENYLEIPYVTEFEMNETSSTTQTYFDSISYKSASLNASIEGDLNGTLNFNNITFINISSGVFEGKGFSKGNWTANIENVSRQGSWQGMFFDKPEEKKIYLKGSVSGDLRGIVEGYLVESVNGSSVYDHYIATWTVNHIGSYVVYAEIDLNGTLNYQSCINYSSELYVVQSFVEGNSSGYYNGSLSIVLTHVRIDNISNPYYGEGFSIISYTSTIGSGEGWVYNSLISENISELNGLFTDPLLGILTGNLNEVEESISLSLFIEKLDYGLPPRVDLKVRTWGPERVSPGQTVNYIIEYRNDGLKVANDVMVFYFPSSSVNISSISMNASYDEFYHRVTWDVGMILPSTRKFLNVEVLVDWGLPQGSTFLSSAYIFEMSTNGNLSNRSKRARDDCNYPTGKILYLNGIDCRPGSVNEDVASQWSPLKAKCYGKEGKWYPIYTKGVFRYKLGDKEDLDKAEKNEATDNNGLTNPKIINECYDYIYAYSGGTRTAVTAILNHNLRCQHLVLMSPIKGENTENDEYKADLQQILNDGKVKKSIQIYQSSRDTIDPWGIGLFKNYQAKFDPNDDWFDDNTKILSPKNHLGHGDFPWYVLGWQFDVLNNQGSFIYTRVQTARDPNIKYGPNCNVLPGEKLNYTIEFENEGEGIAFGVYFMDTLDEDLNDTSLDIGSVISTINGSVIAPPGSYNSDTRTITWFVGEVGPSEGGYANISIDVKSELVETEIINYGTVYFPSVPEVTRTNGIVSTVDIIPPRYSNVGQNMSEVYAGDPIQVFTIWEDGLQLDYAWFETNESGVWENISFLKLWGNGWSNFTIQPENVGMVCWRIHANDTSGNENVTPVFCFDVLSSSPIAMFNYIPISPGVGENITFNASQSYDPNGYIVNYSWDFGDGNITNTTDPVLIHFYDSLGDYIVNLTVMDDDGRTDNILKTVSIKDFVLPEIIDNTPDVAYTGDSFTFNATVTDNINVSTAWVEYWYNSGEYTNMSLDNTEEDYWEKTIIIDNTLDMLHYIFSSNDTYDNWNNTGIKNVNIYDNDGPMIFDNTPSIANAGQPFTLNATVTDNIQVSSAWVEYWYDDGVHNNESMINVADDYWEKSIIINLTSEILHYVFAVVDTSDNWVKTGVNDVPIIPNSPPDAPVIDGPLSGTVGVEYEYTFTSNDSNDDDIAEYIVNWGDDTGEENITGPFPSGSPATANHTWTSQGTYAIKAKSIDIYGSESEWGTLEVTMPRDKATNNMLFLRFLERFPILRQRIGL